MKAQTGRDHMSLKDPEIQNRTWITWVRDPVSHFLSGFAECGYRRHEGKQIEGSLKHQQQQEQHPYATRLQLFLRQTVSVSKQQKGHCEIHSFPQANTMFTSDEGNTTVVDHHMEMVGDRREMEGMLALVHFRYNHTVKKGNVAAQNTFKAQQFPPNQRDKISNATMIAICEFVAVDYFLFDFEPPEVCKERLRVGFASSIIHHDQVP
jgi:hypothetical protein